MTLLPETRCTEASQAAFAALPEPRARLTAQRGTRRLRLSPKYGSGPREVDVGQQDGAAVFVHAQAFAGRELHHHVPGRRRVRGGTRSVRRPRARLAARGDAAHGDVPFEQRDEHGL